VAESSTGYLRMKSHAQDQDSSYLPMNGASSDYMTGTSPSYLTPHTTAHDDDDDDDDDDTVETLQPASAAGYTNDTSIASVTQDNAEKPLLSRPSQTAPQMKYSAVPQYSL